MSTNARKPPSAPEPRHVNRPLAQPSPEPTKNPLTTEVMQRIRKVIHDSQGAITVTSAAEEIGLPRQQLNEYLKSSRSAPNSERLCEMQRWLAKRDPKFLPEFFLAKKVKATKPVGALHITKITEGDVRAIRTSEEPERVLAERHGISRRTVRDIQSRKAWAHVA